MPSTAEMKERRLLQSVEGKSRSLHVALDSMRTTGGSAKPLLGVFVVNGWMVNLSPSLLADSRHSLESIFQNVARARCDVSSLQICADAGHSSAIGSFQAVAAFIVALTSTDSDGRVIVTSAKPGGQPHEATLKFVMLNAAKHFQPVSSLYLVSLSSFSLALFCSSAFMILTF